MGGSGRGNDRRENLLWYAPNVLTQIPQKQSLTMTVKLELHGEAAGDFGGIGMVGLGYGYIGLYQAEQGMGIRCYQGNVITKEFLGEASETCVYRAEEKNREMWLKLELKGDKTYELLYSPDGKTYTMAAADLSLREGTWTGAKLCLWACARENEATKGYCDYQFVKMEGAVVTVDE